MFSFAAWAVETAPKMIAAATANLLLLNMGVLLFVAPREQWSSPDYTIHQPATGFRVAAPSVLAEALPWAASTRCPTIPQEGYRQLRRGERRAGAADRK
jgi:hypothetical protein